MRLYTCTNQLKSLSLLFMRRTNAKIWWIFVSISEISFTNHKKMLHLNNIQCVWVVKLIFTFFCVIVSLLLQIFRIPCINYPLFLRKSHIIFIKNSKIHSFALCHGFRFVMRVFLLSLWFILNGWERNKSCLCILI